VMKQRMSAVFCHHRVNRSGGPAVLIPRRNTSS
jgi:hypothetical protein